jgi:hypothetical protein
MVITHFCYMPTSLRLNLVDLDEGSDIVYTNVLGQSIIILDKYETAVELLDKRSGSYSSRYVFVTSHSFREATKANLWSRPISPVLQLIPGWGDSLALLPYGTITLTVIMLISLVIQPSFLGDRWYVR